MDEAKQQQVFKEWLTQHKGIIFKVVRAYAFDPLDQDDLFQEISIQVWHSVPAFRRESAISTWIYRVALNTAIKWLNKTKRHRAAEELEKVQHVLEETRLPPDPRLQWLYGQIAKLDEIDRSLTLLLLDDFSYKEMAIIIGISESNVGVKINRIKKYLISQSKNTNHGI